MVDRENDLEQFGAEYQVRRRRPPRTARLDEEPVDDKADLDTKLPIGGLSQRAGIPAHEYGWFSPNAHLTVPTPADTIAL
jgi:hypothetical protein